MSDYTTAYLATKDIAFVFSFPSRSYWISSFSFYVKTLGFMQQLAFSLSS